MPLIAFASPKGGVGKTTVSAHMAAILARRGHQVIAIDLDPQNALRMHLGVPMREEGGFLCDLESRPNWRDCLVETPSGVKLLPFGPQDPLRALELSVALMQDPSLLAEPVRDMLATPGQIVIIDSPPGPNAGLTAITSMLDLMVLILLADGGSAAIIPQIASNRFLGRGTLASRMADRGVVILNQVDAAEPLSDAVLDMAQATLGKRLIGAICRDQGLAEALADRSMLLDGEEGAGEDFQLLADALVARLRLTKPERPGYRGLFEWRRP
ncbi:cellulose synthase operon protein YhjQ/BcsQ [Roseococcus pinisoli]|uniref:AAA family ATPase n=1 Tax=Roseococcus pinisoli TaxID=2835040 RepID=A0ABS5QKH5_9PROT|nr:cellulose synthase operon protein YhjQ/BcsQ [Roseococcus pinisoli]MBS7813577.1 AAA family ATPase [Roseococcus pinisoli]